jgi:hypothetical protein
LKDGGWLALLTESAIANSTTVILPDGLTTIATTGTSVGVSNDTSSITVNGINWTTKESGGKVAIYGIDTNNDATVDCNFNSTRGPAILFIEPKKWDDSSYGDYICVPLTTEGTSTVEIAVSDPVFKGTNSGFVTLETDNNLKQAVDKYGSFLEKEETENNIATITYPTSQMFLDILVTEEGATVTSGSATSGNVEELGSVTRKDSEVSGIQDRNLIVIGGSCINSVAAKLLDVAEGTCGSAFTDATGVGVDQFLIKVVDSPYTDGRVAMLVAGYEAADTAKAVEYVTMEKPMTDVGTDLKKVTGTYADVE